MPVYQFLLTSTQVGLSKMIQTTKIFWVNSSCESVDSSQIGITDSKMPFSNNISSLKHRAQFLHLVACAKHIILTCKGLQNHNKSHLLYHLFECSLDCFSKNSVWVNWVATQEIWVGYWFSQLESTDWVAFDKPSRESGDRRNKMCVLPQLRRLS